MVFVKATADSEAGKRPSQELFAEMGKFNEELIKAKVLVDAGGLRPTKKSVRVRIAPSARTVIDGPFTETKELIAGFTMIQVGSRQEALDWIRRWPASDAGGNVELELRQVFEAEDFGAEFTPELRATEERLRAEVDQRASGAAKR
jgi:hypothetical protein